LNKSTGEDEDKYEMNQLKVQVNGGGSGRFS